MFGGKRGKPKSTRKLKITEERDVIDGELIEEVWSKKRILIMLTLVGTFFLVGVLIFRYFSPIEDSQDVLSAADQMEYEPTPKIPSKKDVESVIKNAAENLQKITEENVTSSQAAIQKIIQDLQSIQEGSKSSTNVFCKVVCGN